MNLTRITAIFDDMRLPAVEAALIEHGVSGFTLHAVRGRGRYFDSYNDNHLVKHVELEIYAQASDATAIAELLVDTAHVGSDSEGLVCIAPVDGLYWIHDRRRIEAADFHYHALKRRLEQRAGLKAPSDDTERPERAGRDRHDGTQTRRQPWIPDQAHPEPGSDTPG